MILRFAHSRSHTMFPSTRRVTQHHTSMTANAFCTEELLRPTKRYTENLINTSFNGEPPSLWPEY